MAGMKKYWFKRRRYGWGWIPVTWQGWLTVFLFLVIIVGAGMAFNDEGQDEFSAETGIFVLILILALSALIKINYAKGPTPKWRWGKSPDDDPERDW